MFFSHTSRKILLNNPFFLVHQCVVCFDGPLCLFSIFSRYMLAEGVGLSGIVSILFTGIVSAKVMALSCIYTPSVIYHDILFIYSLGHEALHFLELVRQFSKICICLFPFDIIIGRDFCVRIFCYLSLAVSIVSAATFLKYYLSCRFIYMGFDIAMEKHSWSHVGFILCSIVSLSYLNSERSI